MLSFFFESPPAPLHFIEKLYKQENTVNSVYHWQSVWAAIHGNIILMPINI